MRESGKKEGESVCVCVCQQEREREERMKVRVHLSEIERQCASQQEREREPLIVKSFYSKATGPRTIIPSSGAIRDS